MRLEEAVFHFILFLYNFVEMTEDVQGLKQNLPG